MTSNYVCRACFRALRVQQTVYKAPIRHLSSTPFRSVEVPKAGANVGSHSVFADVDKHDARLKALQAEVDEVIPPEITEAQRAEYNAQLRHLREVGMGKSTSKSITSKIRARAPQLTETYTAYGVTEEFMKQCVKQADYAMPNVADGRDPEMAKDGEEIGAGLGGWWLDGKCSQLKLPPTFSTWAQVSFLHMYLYTTRLRVLPAESSRIWQQHLTDHFFNMAENRMITHHRLSSGSLRQRYLKDIAAQWRGCLLSYDEGLMRGDAVLAGAVWRNVFKANEEVDGKALAQIVSWMRKELWMLDKIEDTQFVENLYQFDSPAEQSNQVMLESRYMRDGPQQSGSLGLGA